MKRRKARKRIRLNATFYRDAEVRLAKAGAAWPWALCKLEQHGGRCTSMQLHPRLCSEDIHIPEEMAAAQLDGLREFGLLIEMEPGVWVAKDWASYQVDPRPVGRIMQDDTAEVRPTGSDRSVTTDDGAPGVHRAPARPARASSEQHARNESTWKKGGVLHYSQGRVQMLLCERWPDEDWNRLNHARFCGELAREFSKAQIDAALASQGSKRLHSPFGLRRVIEAKRKPARGRSKATPATADEMRARRVLDEIARLKMHPEDLDALMEDSKIADIRPPPALAVLFRERLVALRQPVPELFSEE